MPRPTIYSVKSIAAQAGVSTATVSRVINRHPGVDESTRAKVMKLMQGASCPTRAVDRPAHILIMLDTERPLVESFQSEIISGVAKYALEHRVSAELVFLPRSQRDMNFLKFVRERRCDGLVGVSMGGRTKELKELSDCGIPVMLIDETARLPHSGHMMMDSFKGSIAIVEYLASLGHERIGFLANEADQSPDLAHRREGYKEGLRRTGREFHPEYLIDHIPCFYTHDSGLQQARLLLERSPEVTAIFASTDEMAYGAIRACMERGLSVPGDISVVGVDDYYYSAFWNPRLTTLSQPLDEFAFESVHQLDMHINGLTAELPRRTVEGVLVKRESCASPRHNKQAIEQRGRR